MSLFLDSARCSCCGWQPRGHRRTDHGRRVRRVQRLPDDAQLADDCVRLGHEHAAARHGVVEADARGARRGRRRSQTTPSAARRRFRASAVRPPSSAATIEFRDLTFAYGDATPCSNHVSLRIEAGQTVALVGADGVRQVDADQPAAAAARSAARHGLRRRRRRSRDPARRRFAARSASCRRSRSCSPTRSRTTSRSG